MGAGVGEGGGGVVPPTTMEPNPVRGERKVGDARHQNPTGLMQPSLGDDVIPVASMDPAVARHFRHAPD